MASRIWVPVALAGIVLFASFMVPPMPACCPAPPSGRAVLVLDKRWGDCRNTVGWWRAPFIPHSRGDWTQKRDAAAD